MPIYPTWDESASDVTPEQNIAPSATIHETAWVDNPCQIGERTSIMHFSHVMAHSMIGKDCHIAQHVTVYNGVMLHNGVRVMENARLNSGVVMESGVTCGPSVSICGLGKLRANRPSVSRISPTLIRKNALLGPNVTVAAGVTIGQHAFVEANTVVDSSVPDFAIVSGNTLTILGFRCHCGAQLPVKPNGARRPKSVACDGCQQTYHSNDKGHWQPSHPIPTRLVHHPETA